MYPSPFVRLDFQPAQLGRLDEVCEFGLPFEQADLKGGEADLLQDRGDHRPARFIQPAAGAFGDDDQARRPRRHQVGAAG